MSINYALQDNMIFDPSTGVQSISQEVMDWCKTQHFFNSFDGILIAIIAFALLLGFLLWKFLCENHAPLLKSIGEERAERVANALVWGSFLVLTGFLAWFFFVFKPSVM